MGFGNRTSAVQPAAGAGLQGRQGRKARKADVQMPREAGQHLGGRQRVWGGTLLHSASVSAKL